MTPPTIVRSSVYPVAGHDSMELNLSGAHAPYFTRNVLILEDSDGNLGVGAVPGGLKITNDAQVVDTSHQPIPGLYAAGEMVGGLFYFNYPGATGLMSGAVFGRIAGRNAASAAKLAKAA